MIAVAAAALASASSPATAFAPAAVAGQAAVAGAASSGAWDTYKYRLSLLARQQGVRQADHPGQRARPVDQPARDRARADRTGRASSGGVVGALSPYLRAHVTSSLISRGRNNYAERYRALRRLEVRYGVDPAILMAIWGHETSYGTVTGSTDLLQALASLGYYGRRRDFFESEFIAALKLIDQGVPRWRLKGSWAGATGYPQFMPSVALRLRADGDGDGYADIWANELDGLASIATYLRDAGWKPNVAWGIPVRAPADAQPRRASSAATTAPRCPQVYRRHSRWLTMREWRALG